MYQPMRISTEALNVQVPIVSSVDQVGKIVRFVATLYSL